MVGCMVSLHGCIDLTSVYEVELFVLDAPLDGGRKAGRGLQDLFINGEWLMMKLISLALNILGNGSRPLRASHGSQYLASNKAVCLVRKGSGNDGSLAL